MTEFNEMLKKTPLNKLTTLSSSARLPSVSAIDKRTRAEWREDFEKELSEIDVEKLEVLKDEIWHLRDYEESHKERLWEKKKEIQNSLVKFIRTYKSFEELNAEEYRKIELKKKELKLDTKADWGSKFRLFFFRVLASLLFIVTLFGIGYIEHNYDWAKLPMAKYIKPVPNASGG